MIDHLRGARLVAGLTVLEAWRQHLWIPVGLAMLAVALGLPFLRAVDETARLKLGIAALSGVQQTIAVLLAVLLSSSFLRRDADDKVALLLFAKPLTRLGYGIGRYLGTVAVVGLALAGLGGAGALGLALAHGGLPTLRHVQSPQQWEQFDAFGGSRQLYADSARVLLSGAPGGGVRWLFSGLDPSRPAQVLLRGRVAGVNPDFPLRRTRVLVRALVPQKPPVSLQIAPTSPYGAAAPGEPLAQGEAYLVSRGEDRQDVAQDYLCLELPPGLHQGSLLIELIHREAHSTITLDAQGAAYVAHAGAPFVVELGSSCLVLLAQAGLLGALALAVASVANVGVSLLACGTVLIAAHSHQMIAPLLERGQVSQLLGRGLHLFDALLPDFTRYRVAERLAGSEAVGLDLAGLAWLHYGQWTLVFLALAWWAQVRRDA